MSYVQPSTTGYFIYSKSDCPACDETKKLLPKAKFVNCDTYLEADVDEFLDFVWSKCKDKYPRSFPMIFFEGNYIGGIADIQYMKNFNMDDTF